MDTNLPGPGDLLKWVRGVQRNTRVIDRVALGAGLALIGCILYLSYPSIASMDVFNSRRAMKSLTMIAVFVILVVGYIAIGLQSITLLLVKWTSPSYKMLHRNCYAILNRGESIEVETLCRILDETRLYGELMPASLTVTTAERLEKECNSLDEGAKANVVQRNGALITTILDRHASIVTSSMIDEDGHARRLYNPHDVLISLTLLQLLQSGYYQGAEPILYKLMTLNWGRDTHDGEKMQQAATQALSAQNAMRENRVASVTLLRPAEGSSGDLLRPTGQTGTPHDQLLRPQVDGD